MSRRIVGYEGEGRHRRPVYEDLGPARAGDVGGLAAAGRLSALDIRGTDRPEGAGPVERRLVTDAERAARRDDRPAIDPAARLQQSRLNGAARTSAIHAARRAERAPQEEPAMVEEPRTEPDTSIEPSTPLEALADAAARADAARRVKEAADEAWRSAAAQLEASMAEVNAILATPTAQLAASIREFAAAVPVEGPTNGSTNIPDFMHPASTPTAVATKNPAARQAKPKPGGDAKRAADADTRARRVLDALARHGGDTRKAGDELGLRGNVVGRIASSARARQIAAESAAVEASA